MDVDYMAGEDDITFFESEDERWMMGDFDVDLEVDLGRPIDFEADESVTNHDDSGFQEANNSSGNMDPRKATSSVSGPGASGSGQRDGAVSVSGHNAGDGNTGLGSSTNRNSNSGQRPGGTTLAKPTSAGVVNPNANRNNGNGKKEVSFQPLPNVRSSGNGNNRGQPLNGPTGPGTGTGNRNANNGNGNRTNLSSSTSEVQPSGSGNSRPSAGGFTFPPGPVRTIPLAVDEREVNERSFIGTSPG